MKIRINGADADIRLEEEKNIGQILGGLEQWLDGTGQRLSGIALDGKSVEADSMETCFAMGIEKVQMLDIYTSFISDIFAEGLRYLLQAIDTYEQAGFEEKKSFALSWAQQPAAKVLAEQGPGLSEMAVKTFSGEGSGIQVLRAATEERLQELHDPSGEIERTVSLATDVCSRLEELPLDIQTGKDARAAETVGIFSALAEKVLRVYGILKNRGFPVGTIKADGMPIDDYIAGFHSSLQELLGAYQQSDTVLVGDIAEYEMAPKMRALHAAVLTAAKGA